jgi:hypothetical protein
MDDTRTYQIEIQGWADEKDLNAVSLLQVAEVRRAAGGTHFTVQTDQSGLIGLLRALHGRGFVLLSVQSGQKE